MSLSSPQPFDKPFKPEAAPQPFGNGRTYVQVGIFRDRSNAERLRRELGSLGPVEVAPLQVGAGAEAYRVRVGPFSEADASRTQSRIATYGVVNTAIVND